MSSYQQSQGNGPQGPPSGNAGGPQSFSEGPPGNADGLMQYIWNFRPLVEDPAIL